MKHRAVGIIAVVLLISVSAPAYASDWDTFGKVAAAIEGMRILTGGNVDIFGTIGGIPRYPRRYNAPVYSSYPVGHKYHTKGCCEYCTRIWVPHYVWRQRFVPAHQEYSEEFGTLVIVKGHWQRYKVKEGGHWEVRCTHHTRRSRHKQWCCAR